MSWDHSFTAADEDDYDLQQGANKIGLIKTQRRVQLAVTYISIRVGNTMALLFGNVLHGHPTV